MVSSREAPQENDAKLMKFRFAIHPQGIRQFHDNCKIAKCQTVATLAPVYQKRLNLEPTLPTYDMRKISEKFHFFCQK